MSGEGCLGRGMEPRHQMNLQNRVIVIVLLRNLGSNSKPEQNNQVAETRAPQETSEEGPLRFHEPTRKKVNLVLFLELIRRRQVLVARPSINHLVQLQVPQQRLREIL